MSNSVFDDLARTLAEPMSRRRAARIITGAVAAVAFPAFTAAPARARNQSRFRYGTFRPNDGCSGVCTPPTRVCGFEVPQEVPAPGSKPGCNIGCCIKPGQVIVCCNKNKKTGSWCCPEGYTCGSGANTAKDPNCRCTNMCKDGSCCPRSKGRCVNGTCCPLIRTTTAPGTGGRVYCCPAGTIAVPKRIGLCCRKGKPGCCDEYDPTVRGADLDKIFRELRDKGQVCVNGKLRKQKTRS